MPRRSPGTSITAFTIPSARRVAPHLSHRKTHAMDIQTATEQLRAKVGNDCGLGALLKFDCGADGAIVVDATKVPNTLSNDASIAADCTVALGIKTLGDLLSGDLEPTTGFMMGKFKVSGDMSVALKLQRIV
jgi:putative sterol carrier protein